MIVLPRGFTTIEALIAVALLAIVLAIGMPSMASWVGASGATNAAQFYAEGYTMARGQALANNSRSRLVFSENAQSGQLDWQVDVCFPVATDACTAGSNRWSSVEDAADAPEGGGVATRSVHRSAAALPRTAVLTITPNDDAGVVYFTELGWVDGGKPAVTRLDLTPAGDDAEAFVPTSVVLTLAGAVVTCRSEAQDGDSRKCP